MIKIGDALPHVTLYELPLAADGSCSAEGPQELVLPDAAAGKTIALFSLPGAFTPTCSEQHVPGYLEQHEALRAAGVDEIWCMAVNDAFVMSAWGAQLGVGDRIRMIADGDAAFAQATGLTLDLSGKGFGVRSQRFSMLVRDGKVEQLNIEAPGKFQVSDAETLLGQLKG